MVLKEKYLNVAAEISKSTANGPGVRYAVWFQGCPFKCPGCFNKEFQPNIVKNLIKVEDMAKKIISTKGIEGVTYSGGEPMMQASGLYHLSKILKEKNLSIVCYTGFTFEELKNNKSPYVKKLISCPDILIDGRYEKEKAANLPWRGSANQKVHFLTDRYKSYESFVNQNISEVEFITSDKGFVMTGTWSDEFNKKLKKYLKFE